MQNIAYGEYLPTILGVDFMKNYGLIVTGNFTFTKKYNIVFFVNYKKKLYFLNFSWNA